MITVVGVGADGLEGLSPVVRDVVVRARTVLAGRRHLAMLPALATAGRQQRRPWPSPLRAGLPALLDELDAPHAAEGDIVVLASGDPLRSGIGTTLVDLLGADAVRILPTVSSDTLARARMGWAAEQCDVITLVGRDPARLRALLDPGARLVVLCSDGTTPATVARLLCDEGCGDSTVTALWQLGGPAEGRWTLPAREVPDERTDDLVVLCLEVDAGGAARRPALGRAPGLPEDAFDTDGQLTKRDVRASALAHLRPTSGALLWDLGAGTGSIGVEWCRAAERARCVAVEQRRDRAERVTRNAAHLGVPDRLDVVVEDALAAVRSGALPDPDAVFIGGGVSWQLLEEVWRRLRPGGRVVGHAVTLDGEAALVRAASTWGGELTRLSVEHARPLGRHLSWTPARPVVQWSATRGDDAAGSSGEPDAGEQRPTPPGPAAAAATATTTMGTTATTGTRTTTAGSDA